MQPAFDPLNRPRAKSAAAVPGKSRAALRPSRAWLFRIGLVLAIALLVQFSKRSGPITDRPAQDLAQRLAREFNLSASPSDVHWFGPSASPLHPLRAQHAWVLAAPPGAEQDVYLVRARRGPRGALLDLESVHNLTRTSAVSERQLTARGPWAAWATGDGNHTYGVHWADASRSPLAHSDALSRGQRWQWRLQWLQQTGSSNGILERHFKLIPPPTTIELELEPAGLRLISEQGNIELPPELHQVRSGGHLLQEQTTPLPSPGNWITWSVDRVRSMPWFGDENMQRLKAVAYHAWDLLERHVPLISSPPEVTMTTSLATSAGAPSPAPPGPPSAAGAAALPERQDWPPPPLQPQLDPALPGEGQWRTFENDPFVRTLEGFGSPLASTFLRVDPDRPLTRVLITAWDPALVDLHMISGTDEPVSATGETGSGQIPRDAQTMTRLVAAFNGGFQGHHGDFGMLAEGTLYVPPKPYAATVARLRDGSIGFGTWPESRDIPGSITSFRQNLTPLVAEGRYNPYHRSWWGGVPSGWEDTTRTVRSGLCLTKSGMVAYFYASKAGPKELGEAMLAAECTYGLHLDMNQGHTGLELYHVGSEADVPPLAMPLDAVWQAQGRVPDSPELRFRGRRLFKSMQLMNFPRYIRRQTRDFFYLTLREMLPGPAPSVAGQPPSPWRVTTLPQDGFPPAMATSSLRPNPDHPATVVQLWQVDARWVGARPAADTSAPLACFETPSPAHDWEASGPTAALWLDAGRFAVGVPPQQTAPLLGGTRERPAQPRAAIGLRRDDQVLVYAEIVTGTPTATDGETLTAALRASGAEPRLYREEPWRIALAERDLSGHPVSMKSAHQQCLFRSETRAFRMMFKETPIVKRAHWKPLQEASR